MNERLGGFLLPRPALGDLKSRIDTFIEERTRLNERMLPYLRSSQTLRWRSNFLQAQYAQDNRGLRNQLIRFFPELKKAPADLLEAMDNATSLEAWDRLRDLQSLSRARAAAVQRRTVEALLAETKV